MALSTQDAATLASLQAAYDKLISGQSVALVQENGSKTEWARGDVVALKARIDSLNAAAASSIGRTRGAIRFRIGNGGFW